MSRQVTKFLEAHQNQEVQVVILAAGYDLLAFTLSQKFTNVPFIEIDHPATGEAKVRTMKKMIDQLPRNLYFCHDAIGKNSTIQEALSKNGLTLRKIPTVIIMEGLSFYLTEEENREIFRELGELFGCDGSIVAFDFFSLDEFGRPSNPNVKRLPFLSSLVKYKVKLMGEPFKFGIAPAELPVFFRETGWEPIKSEIAYEDPGRQHPEYATMMGIEYEATVKWASKK